VFDRCVALGKACATNNDCATGEYCETAVEPTAGTPPSSNSSDASACSAEVAYAGRCVQAPPRCTDSQASIPGCVEACEYRPPVQAFQTAEKWRWGYDAENLEFKDSVDVWSTPMVGRLSDTNCDGRIDELDTPSLIFIAGDTRRSDNGVGWNCQNVTKNIPGVGTRSACHLGVLRVVNGRTGQPQWSRASATGNAPGLGISGVAPALADINGDGRLDIVVVTGDGYVQAFDGQGNELARSTEQVLPYAADINDRIEGDRFGWGGGLAVADVNGDGAPEIAYGSSVFTTAGGGIRRVFRGALGIGGRHPFAFSFFADVDPNTAGLELVAGRTVYKNVLDETIADDALESVLWDRPDLNRNTAQTDAGAMNNSTKHKDGFAAVADIEKDGKPEVVVVLAGFVYALNALTGETRYSHRLDPESNDNFGGPPTIADFDGDGLPEIGLAQSLTYYVMKPEVDANTPVVNPIEGKAMRVLWGGRIDDGSFSNTGSTVFDFEGDGKAEVIHADECYLRVWGYDADAKKPVVRFATPTTSFTATESPVVADVDGDGHAEIVLVANRANPQESQPELPGWACDVAPWNSEDPSGRPEGTPRWVPPAGMPSGDPKSAYRGVRVLGDKANAWVGTRALWNQHAYQVTGICDSRDSACATGNVYGAIPRTMTNNWTLPWLNNFRQNVQDKGIFDAPDAVTSIRVECTNPPRAKVSIKNKGLKALPAGVQAEVFAQTQAAPSLLGTVVTSQVLLPGQTQVISLDLPNRSLEDRFFSRIRTDAQSALYQQCRADNDTSAIVAPECSVVR